MQKRPRRARAGKDIPACPLGLDEAFPNGLSLMGAMARLEALLAPAADDERLREAMASLARELGGIFTWLDGRNASINLTVGPRALAVQVLLELRVGGELEGLLLHGRQLER